MGFDDIQGLASLFEGLPHVMFSLKGRDGRYLAANQAFADRASCKSPAAVVGRRAADLFAPELAASYEAQDARLLGSGRPVRRQLELIARPDGSLGWYVTNKVAVLGAGGAPEAIAAVSVDERAPVDRPGMPGLEAAVDLVRRRFAEPLGARELAEAAAMTPSLLERRMRRLLGTSPRQLILRVRVEEAVHRITEGDEPLAMIAPACGFSDQAAMTRQVKRLLGVTPGVMRTAAREARRTNLE
ncbi:MAG: helix-turn-helix domain-containing protein [Acidimicrobiales bacterium]